MLVDAELPKSMDAKRTAEAADSPLIRNPTGTVDAASIGLSRKTLANDATAMAPVYSVGGNLTTTTTVDLTAAPDARNPTIARDCSSGSRRLLAIELYCPATNSAAVNVAPGGSPYPFLGASNDIDVLPGCRVLIDFRPKDDDTAPSTRPPAVAAGVKHITFTIGASDSIKWNAVFGS